MSSTTNGSVVLRGAVAADDRERSIASGVPNPLEYFDEAALVRARRGERAELPRAVLRELTSAEVLREVTHRP